MAADPKAALAEAMECVGDRWTLPIVDALLGGPRRFNDLQSDVQGIAPNILAARLRRLADEGVVLARPYSRRPQRLAYELTGSGRELAGALRLLTHWGAARSEDVEPPRHDECGTGMEARWYCPTCDRMVDEPHDAETAELRYV